MCCYRVFFFFKQKTAYEITEGDWSSDVCSSDLARVIPIGRLDYATSGLLLFTNDTQLSHWLTDPATAIKRVYLVTVRGKAEHIDDDRVAVRKVSGKESHLVVTLTEGKNREVRNLVAAYGYSVTQLRRVQFGGLELGILEPGQWRVIPDEEFAAAFPTYKS